MSWMNLADIITAIYNSLNVSSVADINGEFHIFGTKDDKKLHYVVDKATGVVGEIILWSNGCFWVKISNGSYKDGDTRLRDSIYKAEKWTNHKYRGFSADNKAYMVCC